MLISGPEILLNSLINLINILIASFVLSSYTSMSSFILNPGHLFLFIYPLGSSSSTRSNRSGYNGIRALFPFFWVSTEHVIIKYHVRNTLPNWEKKLSYD